MNCQHLLGEKGCPCCLADLDLCKYCTHLQGEGVCNCDWQGFCAYENYIWREQVPSDINENTVVDILPSSEATGIVIKTGKGYAGASLGTVLELKIAGMPRSVARGVVLRTYPGHNVLYLVSFDPVALKLLKGANIEIRAGGNAFLGVQTIEDAQESDVLILAKPSLAKILHPLKLALKERKNRVRMVPPDTEISSLGVDAAIVFMVGSTSEIKRAAGRLPSSLPIKVALWYIDDPGC